MKSLLKLFKWDIETSATRFFYIWFLLKNLPGGFGIELRRRYLCKKLKSCGFNLKILEGVYIRNVQNLKVGNNVSIGVNNFIQAAGNVTLGDNVLLGPGVKIWSANHKYNNATKSIESQGYDFKPVHIEDDVWIGADSFIMPGAIIGKGSVISACSVVAGKQIEPYSILAGNPARKIGVRG